MLALIGGAFLLLARLRLGFLADFLSRTVLIGFLTGVGIQVALRPDPGMLGIPKSGSGTDRAGSSTRSRTRARPAWTTFAVSVSVIS